MDFDLRPMRANDRAFVAKSWVESHASSAMARLVSLSGTLGPADCAWHVSPEYWESWNAVVNRLLKQAVTTVATDDVGLLAGFVCWEPWELGVAVHYVYVRLMHRKCGLAKLLCSELPSGATVYTHRSRGLARIPPGWQYSLRPLLAGLSEAA